MSYMYAHFLENGVTNILEAQIRTTCNLDVGFGCVQTHFFVFAHNEPAEKVQRTPDFNTEDKQRAALCMDLFLRNAG